MHRRAYSGSCKARVMQAKANHPKEIRAAALIVSWRTAPGHASSCVRVVYLCLNANVKLQMPAHSVQNVTSRLPLLGILFPLVVIAGALIGLTAERYDKRLDPKHNEFSGQAKSGVFYPTPAQWGTLTVEPVQQRVFHPERVTEGKIAVDEDRSTPIFSPYAGRVLKLFVNPGDILTVGQPLFTVQAADMVQAQNDFISAATALNKARSALNLAQIIDKRQRLLYEGKAVPLKEVQN